MVSGGATTAGIGAAAGAAASSAAGSAAKMAAGTGGMADSSCSAERGCTADAMQNILKNLTESSEYGMVYM